MSPTLRQCTGQTTPVPLMRLAVMKQNLSSQTQSSGWMLSTLLFATKNEMVEFVEVTGGATF